MFWSNLSTGWKSVYVRGAIQNIPDWCRHLCNSCGSAKRR